MIKGITFDLWDTVFVDDSDELKRRVAGRLTKYDERRQLVYNAVNRASLKAFEEIKTAYDSVDADFRNVWHNEFITWTVKERLIKILDKLSVRIPEQEIHDLINIHETMELEFSPNIISGVAEAIKNLKGKYKLGVISDAIFSPGWALTKLLEKYDLKDCFSTFIFSDEIGNSKPHKSVFRNAWESMEIEPSEMVHIGDREHNDIRGAHQFGVKAILCTAAIDRGSNNTEADAVFSDYKGLFTILTNMNKQE